MESPRDLTVHDVFEAARVCRHFDFDESLLTGARTLFARGRCNCTKGQWSKEADYHLNRYCDTESFAFALLSEGRFLVMRENSDTSGHGCQCDGSYLICAELGEAIHLGLTREERNLFLIEDWVVREPRE